MLFKPHLNWVYVTKGAAPPEWGLLLRVHMDDYWTTQSGTFGPLRSFKLESLSLQLAAAFNNVACLNFVCLSQRQSCPPHLTHKQRAAGLLCSLHTPFLFKIIVWQCQSFFIATTYLVWALPRLLLFDVLFNYLFIYLFIHSKFCLMYMCMLLQSLYIVILYSCSVHSPPPTRGVKLGKDRIGYRPIATTYGVVRILILINNNNIYYSYQ